MIGISTNACRRKKENRRVNLHIKYDLMNESPTFFMIVLIDAIKVNKYLHHISLENKLKEKKKVNVK